MQLFILQAVNGVTLGMLYGLSALGFTMVFKALGYLNFSHSNTITIGALLSYTMVVTCGVPFIAAVPIILAVMLIYGFVVEKVIFCRFQNASPLTFMLVSISLSNVVYNICLLVFGPNPRALNGVFPDISVSVGGARIPFNNICIFVLALLFLGLLQLFFFRTRFGLALRLASEDPSTASLMGIRVSSTRAATFAITALLGGAAGMLIAPIYSVAADLGSTLALKTFIAAVIGGLGNFIGAVAGGILVGFTETMAATYISSAYKDLIVYVAGIAVLVFFPYGIFRRVMTKF